MSETRTERQNLEEAMDIIKECVIKLSAPHFPDMADAEQIGNAKRGIQNHWFILRETLRKLPNE